MLLSDTSERLVYVEVVRPSDGVGPTLHGWRLVILWWVLRSFFTHVAAEYYGVRIARHYVLKTLMKRNSTGTLLDDW